MCEYVYACVLCAGGFGDCLKPWVFFFRHCLLVIVKNIELCVSMSMFVCVCMFESVCVSVYMSVCLSVYMFVCV